MDEEEVVHVRVHEDVDVNVAVRKRGVGAAYPSGTQSRPSSLGW